MSEKRTTVLAGSDYPDLSSPQVDAGFDADYCEIALESPDSDCRVSFDGVNDHLILHSSTNPGVKLRIRNRKMWFGTWSEYGSTPQLGIFQSSGATHC